MKLVETLFNRVKQRVLGQRKKFGIQIPSDIIKIKDVMVANNFDIYLVGGSVRDALLGKTPKDYDLATDATPDQVIELLRGKPFVKNIIETGKAFGVINVLTDTDEYEIATFRADIGSGRRPDAVNFTNIETDVKRRDLTINALFYDLNTGEIVDLVKGRKDLERNIVRTVGKAEERFGEDRLRIMRAIRFASRFGSNLDSVIDTALLQDSSLEGISGERIRDEFIKSVKSAKSIVHLFDMYQKYDLLKWIFGNLNIDTTGIIEEPDPIVLIASILRLNKPEVVSKGLNTLKYPTEEVAKIVFLLRMLNFNVESVAKFKKMEIASKIAPIQLRRFAKQNQLDSILIDAFLHFQLSVTGDMMIDRGMKPGLEMGKAIEELEAKKFEQLMGKAN